MVGHRTSRVVAGVALAVASSVALAGTASAHNGYPDSRSKVTCYNNDAQILVEPRFTPTGGRSSQHVSSRAILWEKVNGKWKVNVKTPWHQTYVLKANQQPRGHRFTGAEGEFWITVEIAWWVDGRFVYHTQENATYKNVDYTGGATDRCLPNIDLWSTGMWGSSTPNVVFTG